MIKNIIEKRKLKLINTSLPSIKCNYKVTEGKIYEIVEEDSEFYRIRNDANNLIYLLKYRFCEVKEQTLCAGEDLKKGDIVNINSNDNKLYKVKLWKEIPKGELFNLKVPTIVRVDGKKKMYCSMYSECMDCIKYTRNRNCSDILSFSKLHNAKKIEIKENL